MGDVRIELNRAGIQELLRSSEMMSVCKEEADKIYNRLGEGYEVSTHIGRNRVNVSIGTESYESMRDNMENNSILKALR